MCGLFGAASTFLTPPEQELFITLGTVSQLRGTDSTGVMWASRDKHKYEDKKVVFHKDVKVFSQFAKDHHAMWNSDRSPMVLAGHTRAATVGQVTKELAHPFVSGTLCGMHNGTVHKFGNGNDVSDSMEIYERMHDNGLQAVLEEIGDAGAYALVWMDSADMTVNFIRNNQRPLYHVKSNHGTIMLWASEIMFLEFAMARSQIKGWGKVEPFTPYTHYKLQMGATVLKEVPLTLPFRESKRSSIFDKKEQQLPLFDRGPVTPSQTHQATAKSSQESTKDAGDSLKGVFPKSKERMRPILGLPAGGLASKKLIPLDDRDLDIYIGRIVENSAVIDKMVDELPYQDSRDPKATVISNILSNGCSWCSHPMDLNIHNVARSGWCHGDVICSKCLEDKENREFIPMYYTGMYVPDYTYRAAIGLLNS